MWSARLRTGTRAHLTSVTGQPESHHRRPTVDRFPVFLVITCACSSSSLLISGLHEVLKRDSIPTRLSTHAGRPYSSNTAAPIPQLPPTITGGLPARLGPHQAGTEHPREARTTERESYPLHAAAGLTCGVGIPPRRRASVASPGSGHYRRGDGPARDARGLNTVGGVIELLSRRCA